MEEQTTPLFEPEEMHAGIKHWLTSEVLARPPPISFPQHHLSFSLGLFLPESLPNQLPGLSATTLGISHSCSSRGCTGLKMQIISIHSGQGRACPGDISISIPLTYLPPLAVQVFFATQTNPSCIRAFAPSIPQPGPSLVVSHGFLVCSS